MPLGMQKPGTSFTPVFNAEGRGQKAEGREKKGRRKRRNPLDYDTQAQTRLSLFLHRLAIYLQLLSLSPL